MHKITVCGYLGRLENRDIGVSAPEDASDIDHSGECPTGTQCHGVATRVHRGSIRFQATVPQHTTVGQKPCAGAGWKLAWQVTRQASTDGNDRSGEQLLGGAADHSCGI